MAHSCPRCGSYCTCSGDWDDIDLGLKFPNCKCDCREDDEDYEYDYTEDWTKEDWDAYYAELKEQEEENRAASAASCTCGSWGFDKTGNAIRIADCICGNE